MPAVVAHHAFRHAGGAGGVEDVQRVRGLQRHAIHRRGRRGHDLPIEIAARRQLAAMHVTLQHHAVRRCMRRQRQCLIQQRLVRHHALHLDAAAGREHHRRLCVIDAHRQFMRCKAAEHHAVHRADASARVHADQRLWHHGHVDDHAITTLHTQGAQHARKASHLVAKFAIRDRAHGRCDRAVVDHRRLLGSTVQHMPIDGVEAGVHLAAGEPAVQWCRAVVQHPVPWLVPMQRRGCRTPEALGIGDRGGVRALVWRVIDECGRGRHGVIRSGQCA